MSYNENPSVPTPDHGGRDTCPECDGIYAKLNAAGIEYEVVTPCNWCKTQPADPDRDMEGCCSLDCRYQLARAEGFVTDAEHAQYVAEGWVPEGAV